MLLGLSFAAWFVVFVVILVFVLQICTKLPSDFVFLGGMGLLLVSGVIPVNSVLGGFSSTTVVLIGALFVVICGLVHTGFLQWVVRHCLGTPKTYNKAITRLMLPVAALSSSITASTFFWKKRPCSVSRILRPTFSNSSTAFCAHADQ